MKKIILYLDKKNHYYVTPYFFNTLNSGLYFAFQALNMERYEDNGICCQTIQKENIVYIWSTFSIKKQDYKEFSTMEEFSKYNDRYEEYYDKRWEEAPKIKITINDWEELQKKWKQIKTELPQCLVFILDDSGPVDKIEIIGKNELSPEDIKEIQIEHEKYLKYQTAKQKYIDSHSDYSDVWRGPQDDEYEADIMKYYNDH